MGGQVFGMSNQSQHAFEFRDSNMKDRHNLKTAIHTWHYQQLIMATAHFTDKSNIDQRSYHLTINLDGNKSDELRKVIYFAILKELCWSTFVIGPHRPALVIADEIEGTRYGVGRYQGFHFHAVLILPVELIAAKDADHDWGHQLTLLCERIHGVTDVLVTKYVFDDSLAGLLSYDSKLVNRPHLDPTNGQLSCLSGVYPWEFDIGSKVQRPATKQRLVERLVRSIKAFTVTPEAFFSGEYLHHFGEEVTTIARQLTAKWRREYPDLWGAKTPAQRAGNPPLRLVYSLEEDAAYARDAA